MNINYVTHLLFWLLEKLINKNVSRIIKEVCLLLIQPIMSMKNVGNE